MNLNHSQKKYLKKNLRNLTLQQIAENLHFSEKEILQYLKKNYPKEKYQKLIKKQTQKEKPSFRSTVEDKISNFNFKIFFKKNWPILTFLTFLVLAVYTNSLNNQFVSDDIGLIRDNNNIDNLSYNLLNHPRSFLRWLLYFFCYKIGGLSPIPYRLLDIATHIGSVIFIYLIISLLSGKSLALITASIFAVHPIQTESVTWISGGIHSQYSMFLLISFFFFLLAKFKNWSKKLYLFSLISFLLAILSTEKAMSFPLIIFFFELAFGNIRKNWKKTLPYFALSFFWLIVLLSGALNWRISTLKNDYYQQGGLENPLIQIPIAISSYIKLIFWPNNLTLYHSELNFTQGQYWLMTLFTLAFFGLIIWAYRKNRQVFFWGSFFVIALMPTMTPLRIGWIVAERYVYFGSLGIIFLIALIIKKIGKLIKIKKISLVILGIILIALSIKTIMRNRDWQNQDNLWLAAEKTSPSSYQNHNNLGDLYARQKEYEKSVEEFKKAIELKPDYADAYHNLANVYHQTGRDDLAQENYKKAIEFNPRLWQSYQNLGAIYFIEEKYDLALETIQKAAEINPEENSIKTNLGIILLRLNEKEKAKAEFEKALQLNPQDEIAQNWLDSLKK